MEPSILDRLLEGNEEFVRLGFDPSEGSLGPSPALRLAVLACMDARYTVEKILGLRHGDASIVRNAGAILDDGALRSLVVAVHLLGVRRVVVLGHTKCGMVLLGRGELDPSTSISSRTGLPLTESSRADFHRWIGGFTDVDESVALTVTRIRRHPLLPSDLECFGLVYDNETGRVRKVREPSTRPPQDF